MKETLEIETEPCDHHHEADDHLGHNLDPKFFIHAQMPRNLGVMTGANGRAMGIGTCGDSLEVFLAVMDGTVHQISHRPNGCIYTVACGSAMTQLALGRSLEQALALTPEAVAEELGGLPDDHRHCAALAVNTLGEAIDDYYQKLWGGLSGHSPRRQPE